MLAGLLPILPSLGLLFLIVVGYIIFKQKMSEYAEKFTSMFQLLTAMTDEINKLKLLEKYQHFTPIPVTDEGVDNTIYEEDEEDEDDDDDDEDYDGDYVDSSARLGNIDEEDDDDDDDEDEDDDDEDEDDEDDEDRSEEKTIDTDIASAEINLGEIIEKQIFIESVDYSKMSSKELKSLAKQRGLGGDNISRLKKQELIDIFNDKTLILA